MFIRDHKKAAIIYKNQKISYSELIKNVNHFANKIDKTKIKKVAIFSENRPEWYYSLYAGWKNGLTVIPIDYMSTAEEFAYIINDCKPDLVFCSENNSKIVNESEIYLKNKFSIIVYEKLDKVSENESNEISFSQINNENDVLIIYSSGTTGKPKGVIITFKNIKYSLRFMGEKGLIKHEDILLSILPFHHALPIGYTIIGPIYFGSTVVIVHSLTKEIIFCILSNNKISIIPAVPRFFESIIQGIKEKITTSPISNLLFRFSELIMNKKFKKLIFKKIHKVFGENIRYFLSGGAALDKDIINDFITLGFDVVEGYGLTETVAIVSMSELGKIRPGSVGKVTDLVDLKIVAGEIVVKGNIMKGYYNNPNETNNAIIDGWFYTGDLGYLDKDGYLYITSRKKEIIVTSSGKNINPSEIENILIEYSDLINELAVFESSSILSVVIYPHFDKLQHIGIKNIKNYFHENIIDPYNRTVAPYKKIMSIVISENELPKTRLGKLKRFELDRFSQKWKIDETFCLNRKKSETEQKLCEILAAILKKDPEALNLKKNYIELGADSLMISEFLDKIYKNFNVQITFSQMFSIPNINDTARHIDNSFKDEYCTILQAEKNDYYKLSSQQKRLYILNQMDTKTTVYNINGAIKIKGSLNVNRIEHVFRKLIQRHESFRTSFHIIDYEPMQKISQNVDFSLELLELEQVSVEKTINSFIRYFDLKKAPLIRVGLLKENENNYLLIVDMHHIISDGTSVGILIQEFMNLYHDNDLKKLDISYKDYSFWQLSASQLQKIKLKKKYWLNQFLDEVPVLNLPYDFHRKTFQSHEGNSFVFMIEKYEKESLRAIAHDVGATLYMAILTVLNILFSKLAANEDIVIGTAVAGRTHSDLHDVIGMFVNTLALRNKPVGEKKFIDFLNEVKETTLTAFDNQEYFFEDLVKDLDLKRDLSRNPIFDIMFILQNMEMEKVVLDKLQVEKHKYDTNVSMFDITFEGWETHEGIGFRLEYCTMLFKQETIEKFVNYLKRIINVVIANPSIKLKDIEILDEEEKKHLLAYNELKDDASNKKTLVDLFEEQLKESSEKIALYFEGNSIRYKELNDRSNQLANYLIAKGLALDETVGIMADRSFELVIGMLGILKAGGAYVPIDPEYPQERKKQMIETSGLNLILTFLNNSTSDVDFNKEIEIVKLSEKSIFAEQGK